MGIEGHSGALLRGLRGARKLCPAKPKCQRLPRLRSVQRRKNINTRHYVSYGLRILWKSRKGFEPCLATRTIPDITNYLIIQEFCFVGCNQFVVASNTLDAKQGHGASFFHRGQQAYIGSLNDKDLPRGHGDYVTAFGTIITLA
jgi:hypothetical protein